MSDPKTPTPTPAANPAPTAPATSLAGLSVRGPAGTCRVTGRTIEAGERFVAVLRDTGEGYERLDFSPEGWEQFRSEHADEKFLAVWHPTMPDRQAKRKLLVDDSVLAELFRRLGDETAVGGDANKLAFRFVLGLLLMRKKLLNYEGTEHDESSGRDIWQVRFRKEEETLDLIDPKLDEDRLDEVGKEVTAILQGGLDEEALEAGSSESPADAAPSETSA